MFCFGCLYVFRRSHENLCALLFYACHKSRVFVSFVLLC
ncbi:unnamed protein product, partial [Brassica oleracea]